MGAELARTISVVCAGMPDKRGGGSSCVMYGMVMQRGPGSPN
jgi:hypothetical protein